MHPWHQNPLLPSALEAFHDQHCREPNLSIFKRNLTSYLKEIVDDNLKPKGYCTKVEYVGSCYDGTGVGVPEFDILAVIEVTGMLGMKPKGAGGFVLSPKDEHKRDVRFADVLNSDGEISTTKLFSKWNSLLNMMKNSSDTMKDAKIRENHSSITIQVKLKDSQDAGDLTINLTPAFKLNDEKLFVRTSSREGTWKITWCYKEKALMEGLDRGSCCRKKCLRMLKVVCTEQTALKKMTSYMLKTILFHDLKDKPDLPWSQNDMLTRFLGLLERAEACLEEKMLVDYFEPGINLLQCGISDTALSNMYHRFKRLRDSEKEFMAALHSEITEMSSASASPVRVAQTKCDDLPSTSAACNVLDAKQTNKLTTFLQEFHDVCARQPQEAMTKAKKRHTYLIRDIIEKDLRQMGFCQKLEFTGSSYEGVKVDNDIEFDVMLIMDGKDLEAKPLANTPGFAILKPTEKSKSQAQFHKILEPDGVISAEKLANKFQSQMQLLFNNREELRNTKFRKHGPAVQMDVLTENGEEWYFVDLVPCYELADGKRFVAKRAPGALASTPPAWRRSFSVEEKKLFDGMDASNGCRKQCLRILKVMRNSEATFKKIASYHLKNVLFHEAKQNKDGWTQANLGKKCMDLLKRLSEAFRTGKLPNYFLPEVNLLAYITPDTLQNMYNRCQRLCENEDNLIKLLTKIMRGREEKAGQL